MNTINVDFWNNITMILFVFALGGYTTLLLNTHSIQSCFYGEFSTFTEFTEFTFTEFTESPCPTPVIDATQSIAQTVSPLHV